MATVTTTGIWTSVNAALPQMQGLNTNLISWGVPYTYNRNLNPGRKQSSYQFEGVSGATVLLDGSEFKLGTFTHYNYNLNPPLMLFTANLQVTLKFDGGGPEKAFNFGFAHNETMNSPGPVPDEVLLPSLQSQETVVIEGVEYAVHITGFRQDGQVVTKFVSPEDRANAADIFAKLVAVAKPRPTLPPVVKPTEPPVVKPTEPPVVKPTEPPVVKPAPVPEEGCRVQQVVGVSTVFAAVLTRLNRRSLAEVLEQVIAEVNRHCEERGGGGTNIDITVVQQQIDALSLKLQLIQKAARELDETDLGQIEALLLKLLQKIDLGPIVQNIHIDVDGRSFDLRRVVEVLATVDQVVNITLQYGDHDGDITGVVFVLTDRTQVSFQVRVVAPAGDGKVVYVFETRDWKGLPAQFGLTFVRRARTHKLCDHELKFEVFDGVEQSNIVFDLCPRIREVKTAS